MEYKKHRLIWDYQVEEDWLNQMSQEGLGLTGYSLATYYFEDEEPGKYIYRSDLLDPKNEKDYLQFMADNGVECVCRWFQWATFRKKSADGPFEIYSDAGSKIVHYRRVLCMWIVVAAINLVGFLLNGWLTISSIIYEGHIHSYPNFVCALIGAAITLGFVGLIRRYLRLIKRLQNQEIIQE